VLEPTHGQAISLNEPWQVQGRGHGLVYRD